MLLKDVIDKVIQILGLEDEVDTSVPSKKLTKLCQSANMIYSELTQEYVHLKTKEKIAVGEKGRIYYDDLKFGVREVLAVRTRGGGSLPFTMYPLYLETEGEGEVEVTYIYQLGELELDSPLLLPPQYTPYVLATGITSEYCYRMGLIDEAIFYKNRYDIALSNLSRRLKSIKTPERRLI